ncbi:MAG TPA: hypothetical protein VFX61_15200 [Micromonosporaceae bacterium]|nr:hypothetical protein [Micromonosporaceae bacterium]
MPHARFFIDAGSGGLLWATGVHDQRTWGHPVQLDALPITPALRDELSRLVEWYDTSLNWDYPLDPGPWRESECREFSAAVRRAMQRLRTELGAEWEILDEFEELHEDPDLDRYLADPASFRR